MVGLSRKHYTLYHKKNQELRQELPKKPFSAKIKE